MSIFCRSIRSAMHKIRLTTCQLPLTGYECWLPFSFLSRVLRESTPRYVGRSSSIFFFFVTPPQIPVSRPKFQSRGQNPSLEAQIPASSTNQQASCKRFSTSITKQNVQLQCTKTHSTENQLIKHQASDCLFQAASTIIKPWNRIDNSLAPNTS